MNSSTWAVGTARDRFVLKIAASRASEPGWRWPSGWRQMAIPPGRPSGCEVRDGRLVALLRYVRGSAAWHVAGRRRARRRNPRRHPRPNRQGSGPGRARPLAVAVAGRPDDRGTEPAQGCRRRRRRRPGDRAAASRTPRCTAIRHRKRSVPVRTASRSSTGAPPCTARCSTTSRRRSCTRGEGVLAPYARTAPIGADEIALAPTFQAFRWAVQAWYFSRRIRRSDLTGLESEADNAKGLADARRGLLGSVSS